ILWTGRYRDKRHEGQNPIRESTAPPLLPPAAGPRSQAPGCRPSAGSAPCTTRGGALEACPRPPSSFLYVGEEGGLVVRAPDLARPLVREDDLLLGFRARG